MIIKEIKDCNCGKLHKFNSVIISGKNKLNEIPGILTDNNLKAPFIVSDINTEKAAGTKLKNILKNNKISYSEYIFNSKNVKPNEEFAGSLTMHYDTNCDIIIGVGSGVINDLCKILSSISKTEYMIVATAPSMDGYASASSSLERDGLKISLNTKAPDYIIGDVDILKNAPERMLLSGLGDMIAKYTSICEWRISNLIIDEYYCESVASLVRSSLKLCMDNGEKLLARDEEAVLSVFDGLINTGLAMNFAECSRPASGTEHYISHIWDMKSLEFGTKSDFHGIQCAIGTLTTIKAFEEFLTLDLSIERAKENIENFDLNQWNKQLKAFIGKGADEMIRLEKTENKYDSNKIISHAITITENQTKIKEIIKEELPSYDELSSFMKKLGMPVSASEIGINDDIETVFKMTKDIRDKYIFSRILFECGLLNKIN